MKFIPLDKFHSISMLRLLIVLFIALNFFSCNRTEEKKKFKIGFSQCISKDDWRKAMDYEMKVEASLYSEIDLSIFQANGSIEEQISQLESMIDNDFDVIIVSPAEPEPLVSLIEKAHGQGIPVIIVDRKINSEKFTAFVGADNLEVGRNAGNFIASSSNNIKNVIEIMGHGKGFPELERHEGFHQIVDNESNINVPYSFSVDDIEKTSQIFDSLQSNHIDYVYAFNDVIAYDAWKIAKSKGVEKEIKFIGVDGLYGPNNGIELVQKGILSASILYPTGGDEAIKIAMKILRNENIEKNNILSTTVIDYRNADIMKNQYNRIYKHQKDIENQQQKIKEQEATYTTQSNVLKIVFALLIISVILGAYSIYSRNNIKRKKRELELQNKKITIQRNQIKKIAKEVKASNEAKTNFFTGLSHEFKTPITLILSSIESLTEERKIKDSKILNELALIFNNSKRLLRVINQLLDFRKLEDKKFIFRASETNLFLFINNIYKDFEREAQKRNIEFKINTNNEDLKIFLDRNLMDKVFFNLLSNAFKFTPNNGKISINIKDNKLTNFVKISVKDSGIGIPIKELESVFQAFYQGSNNNKSSSGIGMHISKEFVNLHKGNIEVNSVHGAEFIITLYKGKAHLSNGEIVLEPDIIDGSAPGFNQEYEDDIYDTEILSKSEEKYTILIIEDNSDLVKFLKNKLSITYEIYTSDGNDGIEKALEIIPDIIICDVNLPVKTGFEICETLKKDLRTSHIPVIILTALGNKESYIKGLESGADLYLTKPFSLAILSQSVKTLLYNREKLRYYYINNIHNIGKESDFGALEQEFLLKMNSIINENVDNSNFTVENLADQLFISRVQLYRKIKAILGISISDYIQNIRLNKAKELLEDSSLSISEIAYSTGFSSPNYFSTAFKSKFNKSPKTFREH